MEALLHWDFSPGLAVASQVRRRFGSSVHPSPSSGSKVFFLVVSFSSASFPLTEESVSLALQSCIGGTAHHLNVFRLSDRRFRFPVSSNKVGHFIYGLKDRVWPDFVCHFSLYRGDISSIDHQFKGKWFSSEHLVEVAQRSPTKFSPNLDVLAESARRDPFSSASELAKFGLTPKGMKSVSICKDDSSSQRSSLTFSFGQFNVHFPSDKEVIRQSLFIGSDCDKTLCQRLPIETLKHLEDLRQAKYSEQEIMEILNIPLIPPKDLVFQFIGCCYRCGLTDHLRPNCPGMCVDCRRLSHKCEACVLKAQPKRGRSIAKTVICFECGKPGHFANSCTAKRK
jgi:hypothetical protein